MTLRRDTLDLLCELGYYFVKVTYYPVISYFKYRGIFVLIDGGNNLGIANPYHMLNLAGNSN